MMRRSIYGALLLLPLLVSPLMAEENATRTLRFVQDDAQDYMVSKISRSSMSRQMILPHSLWGLSCDTT